MLGLGLSIPQLAARGLRLTDLAAAIRALFAAGEQGVWYDPSDLTTLFQDAAGTIPVTAVEQPVGLMLDKSKGLALGPELVTNGDFSSDTWWLKGPGCTISGGVGVATSAASGSGFYKTGLLTTGAYYEITFTVVHCSSGAFKVGFFNTAYSAAYSIPGTYTVRLRADGTGFVVETVGTTTGSIDNVSVRELPGNHAFQSTSTNRPVLSGRYNLLTKTEQFDDAAWTKNANVTITPNSATAPNGTLTADAYTSSGSLDSIYATVSGQSTNSYTALMHFKQGTGRWIRLTIYDGSNGVRAWIDTQTGMAGTTTVIGAGASITSFTCSIVQNGWIAATVIATVPGTVKYVQINSASANGAIGNANGTTYIWGADLRAANDGVGLPAYQRVNTSTDYDTTGFPLYLSFNGSNQWMRTNAIDFTATDKMTVFAGVRKLSDASLGCVAGTFSSGSAGVFELLAPRFAPGEKYGFLSAGTLSAVAITSNAAFSAPATNVLTGIGNISGDQAILRANGVQVGSSTDNQGTGNYGNYSLHLGIRPSSAFPFAGRLYQLVVRGAQSTAQQITDAETYINSKTRAY